MLYFKCIIGALAVKAKHFFFFFSSHHSPTTERNIHAILDPLTCHVEIMQL